MVRWKGGLYLELLGGRVYLEVYCCSSVNRWYRHRVGR